MTFAPFYWTLNFTAETIIFVRHYILAKGNCRIRNKKRINDKLKIRKEYLNVFLTSWVAVDIEVGRTFFLFSELTTHP
jgi:hypothetical protein